MYRVTCNVQGASCNVRVRRCYVLRATCCAACNVLCNVLCDVLRARCCVPQKMVRRMPHSSDMGAKRHQDLVFWQLLHQVRQKIIAITAREPACGDRSFCDSARRTISSACRNTAEGFARYSHPEFAQHVKIALGELAETEDHLDEALALSCIEAPEHQQITELVEHARATGLALHRYLRRKGREG